jgi:uncharacterized protein YodC (DUF2158 family)
MPFILSDWQYRNVSVIYCGNGRGKSLKISRNGAAKMTNFQRNDVVQPVEGGLRMTVEKVSETTDGPSATCIWLDQKGDKKRRDFFFDQLKLIKRSL